MPSRGAHRRRREPPDEERLIDAREDLPSPEGFAPVTLTTIQGDVAVRLYNVEGTTRGVLWVGGVGGGFDSPADGLYPKLCTALREDGIASLRLRYRVPQHLEEATWDVGAGIEYLTLLGIRAVGLVGHSFGGAVAIRAAVESPLVRTVVALASQSFGADLVGAMAGRCSLLLIHGREDKVLPSSASQWIYSLAGGNKRLILIPGARHGLDEAADLVRDHLREWILAELPSG